VDIEFCVGDETERGVVVVVSFLETAVVFSRGDGHRG
jgi:hypothetical protein